MGRRQVDGTDRQVLSAAEAAGGWNVRGRRHARRETCLGVSPECLSGVNPFGTEPIACHLRPSLIVAAPHQGRERAW